MQCIVTYAAGMFSYMYKLISEFLIYDTYHPDNLYLREHGCDDPWVLSKTKWACEQEVWESMTHTKTRMYLQRAVELVLKGCGNRTLVKHVSSEQDLKKSFSPCVRHLHSRRLEPCATPQPARSVTLC